MLWITEKTVLSGIELSLLGNAARILNHISRIDARGVVTKFQVKKYYSKSDVAVLWNCFRTEAWR
jgi:hypothetical protein